VKIELPHGRYVGDATYRDLARAWRSLRGRSRPAASVIAEANGVTVEVILRWLEEARRRGYLDEIE